MLKLSRAIAFLSAISLLSGIVTSHGGTISSTWVGPEGNWTDGSLWSTSPDFPSNGANLYSVTIETSLLTLDQNIEIAELSLGGPATPALYVWNGEPTLEVTSKLILKGGYFLGNGTLQGAGETQILGSIWLNQWKLALAGNTTWSGTLLLSESTVENKSGATLTFSDGARCSPFSKEPRVLNNFGTINANGAINQVALDLTLNNFGVLNVNSSTFMVMGGGAFDGTVNIASGATLYFEQTQRVGVPEQIVFGQDSSVVGEGSITFNSHAPCYVNGQFNVGGTIRAVSDLTFLTPAERVGRSLVLSGQFINVDLGSSTITLDDLELFSGTLTGSGDVTANGPIRWVAGSLTGTGKIEARGGVLFDGLGSAAAVNVLDRTLDCYGNSWLRAGTSRSDLHFEPNAVLVIMPGATFNGSGLNISGSGYVGILNGTIENRGTLIADSSTMFVGGVSFVNNGTIQVANAVLDVRNTANQADIIQSSGSILVQNGWLPEDIMLNGGTLGGYGSLGNLVSNASLAPAGGSLNFSSGTLTLGASSTARFTLKSNNPGTGFGQLINISAANLGGALEITIDPSFRKRIRPTDSFTLLSARTITNRFANAPNGSRLKISDGTGTLIVTYTTTSVRLTKFKAVKKKRGH